MWVRTAQYARMRVSRLFADERGQDLVEYALLTGIIAIAGVLTFPAVRVKMAAAYQAWTANAYAISEPPPPL